MMWYMVYKRVRMMRAWVGVGSEMKDIFDGFVYNLTVGMDGGKLGNYLNRLNRMMRMG